MKKLFVLFVLLIAVGFSATVFAAPAEEGKSGSDLITQGELAQMMVKLMGLYRYLPPDPTDQECFTILMTNKVRPAAGWDAMASVTREDLAQVVILAMGEEGSVPNPEDPASWVATLQGMGVDIESVGQVVSEVPPTKDFKSADFNPASSDPLKQQRFFIQPDERQLQSDLGYQASVPLTLDEVLYVVRGLDPNDFKPEPVTPN